MDAQGMEIVFPGPMTTVQDGGRFGRQKYGIGPSGVMDEKAYRQANYLVGNAGTEAVLEATLMGPTICFLQDTVCAVTGADMKPELDGEPVGMNRAVWIRKGQTLRLAMAAEGCRSYLAFAGGITVPEVLGSRSTNLKCRMGGFEGRKLEKGDILPLSTEVTELSYYENDLKNRKVNAAAYPHEISVRVIPGPQDAYFTKKGWKTFLTTTYTVSVNSDRMGCRLEGEVIEAKNGTDIVSDGIVDGSIQITAGGLPIILLADRQTTGGYAKIATVVSEDLPKLAQVRPGDKITFQKTACPGKWILGRRKSRREGAAYESL